VLAAAARAGAFILEDDWMRDFDLGHPSPPPLASMDDDGHVIYLRSVSKPVAAGLRVAGLAARGPALARLRRGRISDDLFVAPVLQHVALDVLTAPGWPRHVAGLRRALRERRDALAAAIRVELPGCRLELIPAGGLHLWLRLPDHCSDADVAAAAAARGLEVSPGRASFPGEPPGPYLRLSYAAEEPARLRRGADILADVPASAYRCLLPFAARPPARAPPMSAVEGEGEHLLRRDTRPQRVLPVQPFGEPRSLQRQVMAEHRLAQLGVRRVGYVEELGPAVHGDGEFLARQVGGADGRAGRQVAHPHRVPPGAEAEGPVQQVAVDRADQGAPVGGHRGQREQAHPGQLLADLRRGEPALAGDDAPQVRAGLRRALVEQLLQAFEVIRGL